MRTTLDLDEPILQELKSRARKEGKTLGRLASDLLAFAMKGGVSTKRVTPIRTWASKPMAARVDLSDSEALYAAMESESRSSRRVAEE